MNLKEKIIRRFYNKSLINILLDELRYSGIFGYSGLTVFTKQINSKDCPINNDADIKVAVESDIDDQYNDIWLDRSSSIEHLQKGHSLFLIVKNKEYIFSGWIEKKEMKSPCLGINKLVFPTNVCYLTKLFVQPKYRGHGIAAKAFDFWEGYLFRTEGIDHYFGMVEFYNVASSKLLSKKGYVPLLSFRYLIILGIKFYFVTYHNRRKKWKFYFNNYDFLKEAL